MNREVCCGLGSAHARGLPTRIGNTFDRSKYVGRPNLLLTRAAAPVNDLKGLPYRWRCRGSIRPVALESQSGDKRAQVMFPANWTEAGHEQVPLAPTERPAGAEIVAGVQRVNNAEGGIVALSELFGYLQCMTVRDRWEAV